jgi:hypothetical protein
MLLYFISDFEEIELLQEIELLPRTPHPSLQSRSPPPSPSPAQQLKNILFGLLRVTRVAAEERRRRASLLNEGHFFGIGDSNDENIETAF